MFKNYLLIALRNIKRQKLHSFINITGLAIGMACCIVVLLFIQYELSYDKFHENAEQIYRIVDKRIRDYKETSIIVNNDIAEHMKTDFPEVKNTVRIMKLSDCILNYKENRIFINPFHADQSLFDIFNFPLIKGSKENALKNLNSAVITEKFAEKLFRDEEPMGKLLTYYGVGGKSILQVTGVLKNIPNNSHLKFNILIPLKHLQNSEYNYSTTYLLLHKDASAKELEKKLPDFILKYFGKGYASTYSYFLQHLTSIHLNTDFSYDFDKNSDIKYSYILSVIAFIILLIACINFINLSTARASRRSKEVGIRKVVGANRLNLLKQFLGESVFLSFFALLLAILMIEFLLPFFNSIMNSNITLDIGENTFFYISSVLLTLLVGLLSGIYPAFILASFKPVKVLKGDVGKGLLHGAFIRKGLVVLQYSLSLVFIIGTIIVSQQLNYINNKDLGFEKENIINIPFYFYRENAEKIEIMLNELKQYPNIIKTTATFGMPGQYSGILIKVIPEGFSEGIEMNHMWVKDGYFDFFGIDIVEGRNFSKEIASDIEKAIILNEAAVKKIGWKSPIGKRIRVSKSYIPVIGVAKDHHTGTLHEKIMPTVFLFPSREPHCIYIKIHPDNIKKTLSLIKEKWNKYLAHVPFRYSFYDEYLEIKLYHEVRKTSNVFIFSSILAIALACLGLLGLTAFSAERRTKEIGIRKVLGASVSGIVVLLSKEFLKWVVIANIIAWPVAYVAMNKWLQNFAYRINIGWWIFVLAGMLALVIALLTVSFQAVKAARANPVDSLRYE